MDVGADLCRRYRGGDTQALDEIIRLYRAGLTFFLLRYVGDNATAEEIAADVFADFSVHPGKYNGSSSLKTYLYMIGRSRALDVLRRRARHPSVTPDDLPEVPDTAPTPEEQILRDERSRALSRAMETLPEDMRRVLHLLYFDRLSYESAGIILHKNRKQIENLAYRARVALREKMKEERP